MHSNKKLVDTIIGPIVFSLRRVIIPRIQLLLLPLLLLLTFTASSKPAVNVVELFNFYCPVCAQVQAYQPSVIEALKAQGGRVDAVPVFYGGVSAWPSLAYLALPPAQARQGQLALLNAAVRQGLPMSSVESVCEVLQRALPDYPMADCIRRTQSDKPLQRLANTFLLLRHLGIEKNTTLQLPVFVIEQDAQIQAVLTPAPYPDISRFIQAVKERVRALP